MNEIRKNRRKLEKVAHRFFHTTGIPIGYFTERESVYPQKEYKNLIRYHKKNIQAVLPSNRPESEEETVIKDAKEACYLFSADTDAMEEGYFVAGPFFYKTAEETSTAGQLAEWHAKDSLRQLYSLHEIKMLLQQLIQEYFYMSEEERMEKFRIENQKEGILHHTYEQEKVFLNAMKDGNPAAFEWLAQLVQRSNISLGSSNPLRSMKNKLIIACAILSRSAMENGTESNEAMTMSDYFLREIERKQQMEDLVVMEQQIFTRFFHMMQQKDASHYSMFVWKIRELVKSNVNEGVDLSFISEFMNRTPGYISTIFKRECGITVKQFITQEKIKEAKKYLLHTDDSILDIAVQFHFKDQTYFTKVFKKYTGHTPHQFRHLGPSP